MEEFLNFKISESRIVGSVVVSKEHGVEGVIEALSRYDLGNKRPLLRLDPDEAWYQIYYPHPVIHWKRQGDGSYRVDVHEKSRSSGQTSTLDQNSAKLLENLRLYSVDNSYEG